MAILGYNTKGANYAGSGVNRQIATKFTLASAGTLTELHGWVGGGTTPSWILFIYTDSGGNPDARVAYTAPLAPASGADTELAQTGFSVALAAGDYWLGAVADAAAGGGLIYDFDSVSYKGLISGPSFNPPPNPFGTTDLSGGRKFSVWAVVGAAGTVVTGAAALGATAAVTAAGALASGTFTHIKFGTGLTVTDEGGGVIRVDVDA